MRLKDCESLRPLLSNAGEIEAEDIFIDEDLQMIAPVMTSEIKTACAQVKVEV